MADQTIKFVITTDASGAVKGIRMAENAMQSMEKTTHSITSLVKSHWVSMAAAAVGVPMGIREAWDMAEMAARFSEQRDMLNRLAASYGTNADSIITSIKSVS